MDTCWNTASSTGTMASVTANCTRTQVASQWGRPIRPLQTNMMTPTAPNESQNPGDSTAHGSSSEHDHERGGQHHG